jgi:hypothetical protein
MKEIHENKSKETVPQSKLNKCITESRLSEQTKARDIPNPVKGLSLSLYPMNKQH